MARAGLEPGTARLGVQRADLMATLPHPIFVRVITHQPLPAHNTHLTLPSVGAIERFLCNYLNVTISKELVRSERFRRMYLFSLQVFTGNTDRNTIVSHAAKFRARYVRFVVLTWNQHISMRVELYNCSYHN